MTSAEGSYRLRELVALTGFTVRQIRYYIGERLIPGAGTDRGPKATYSQETLDRLLLIAKLKVTPVPPAGRTLTLEEIRRTLDGLSRQEIHRQVESVAQFPPAHEPGAIIRHARMLRAPSSARTPRPSELAAERMIPGPPRETPCLGAQTLLRRLCDMLRDLAHMPPRRESHRGENWRRLALEELEIQIKEPTNQARRTQLGRLARDLTQILDKES